MIRKTSKSKNTFVALTITLILLVTMTSILTTYFSQSNVRINTGTVINQAPKQASLPIKPTVINKTNSSNAATFYYNSSSAQLKTIPISLGTLKLQTYTYDAISLDALTLQTNMCESSFPINDTGSNETSILNGTNSYNDSSSAPLMTPAISLDTSKFQIYSYGGYSVQQPDPTQFFFSFPDNTSQGQLTGSDAVTLNTYAIKKIDFDAVLIAPKISACGFDEMAIFAASDTTTYKGTEFGIRLDLKDGFIYGYVQEPNGTLGEVNFQMLKLAPNDGIIHHYTLVMLGSKVSLYIDGIDYGYLDFLSNEDYSNLTFSICAVVHRFTDDWDSSGDNMMAGNFSLNQQ